MSAKAKTILIHVISCIGFLSLPILFSPDLGRPFLFSIPPFQKTFISSVILLMFFYLSYFTLVPRFYFPKKYLLLALCLIGAYLVVSLLPGFIIHDAPPRPFPGAVDPPPRLPPHLTRPITHALGRNFFPFVVVFVFSLMLRINNRLKQTEKEKLNAELSYLKAQINPHFLFNTLNSIYSLALEKSDHTANAVVKLSGMMRYVLNESHHDFVPLEKEINYISDYIELQKIRLGNTVDLQYDIAGQAPGKKIAPLILIPFIENAFKHGVNPEENSKIKINFVMNNNALNLMVNNTLVKNTGKIEKSGHGIKTTRKRLELIYPERHHLSIVESEGEFRLKLQIQLQ